MSEVREYVCEREEGRVCVERGSVCVCVCVCVCVLISRESLWSFSILSKAVYRGAAGE